MVSAGAPTLLKLLSTKYTVLGDGPSACQFSALYAKAEFSQKHGCNKRFAAYNLLGCY
jgi:hypothetical protein